ncbi:hypothetical protein PR048_003256 [Dryococelus australis]|uniref:Uncharacterized protein n=1 Tax=Dryococelus australis TaxID=614101 RepID=A0ABQ9IMM0_9NEOP|nr:hypothetical protein PR048_003256 [Dryococelus australis]
METEVFMTMVYAATHDLYWEVKVNALCFWEKVIDQQMSHQGMIDGRFPSVTFSRENRKIVTLTEEEVKLRINKALEELGHRGCLQVLLSAIHDCDLQVVYKAVAITTSLSSLLSQYGILPVGSTSRHEVSTFTCADNGTAPQNCEERMPDIDGVVPNSDQIIENIVNESDISLLSQVYHSKMNVSKTAPSRTVIPMKAKDFLLALSAVNLQDLLSERTQWIDNCSESLNCLLDDIIFTHGDPENIIIDCY